MQGSGVGKQVGSMDEEPQVRGCYNITFICTPTNQETVSVLEKTQANNIQNMKANVKSKQQQLYRVVYLQVTIIHDVNCDKMINSQAHKLGA